MEKQRLGPVVAPFAPCPEINRSIAIVGAPTSIGIRTYDSGEPRHLDRAPVLPGLANAPIQRLPDLTPAAWVAQHSYTQAEGLLA